MLRMLPPLARSWRATAVLLAALTLIIVSNNPLSSSEASTSASLENIPPVNGTTITVAGVSDARELVELAPFPIATIGAFDIERQEFSTYVPGAPSFINGDLADNLAPDTIVWLKRGQGSPRSEENWNERASIDAPTSAQSLRAPLAGGLTVGPAGTASLDDLIDAQAFSVGAVMLFDVERQGFLNYIVGAPAHVNTLTDSDALTPESIVWIRRAPDDTRSLTANGAPRFAATAPVENVEGATTAAAPPPSGTSSSGSGAPTTTESTTSTPTAEPEQRVSSGSRDQFLWPFASNSPWNHPIGSGARYASSGDAMSHTLRGEASGARINVTHWTISPFRAEGPERDIRLPSGEVIARMNVPDGARPTPPLVPGDCDTGGAGTEGWADAHMNIVQSDGQMLELFAAKRLCDGNLETRYGPWWHDIRGSGIGERAGHHSGSRAYGGSALGGLVRKWELEAGEIRHALAAAMPGVRFQSGYTWPATSQDGTHATAYQGNVPMGTLAALPPDFDIDSISYSSPYGRAFAKAMQDFGIYMVDSAGNGGMTFYGEPSISELPGWQQINEDLKKLVPHILPVTNNGPDSVGGGGTPRAPMAPPLR